MSRLLKSLFDKDEVTELMESSSLSRLESSNKAELFADCAAALKDNGISEDAGVNAFYVPGRIEVLGKHTDYAGGRSFIAAVEKGFCIVAVPRKDNLVRIFNIAGKDKAEFEVSQAIQPPLGHWSNYPMTAVRRLAKNFSALVSGADIAFLSDLPPASGMSSSSAMIVGFFLVLAECNQITDSQQYKDNIKSKEDLAGYLGTVENGQSFGTLQGDKGVGTFGGSEDHTAILCCKAGTISQYSYCPLQFEQDVGMPVSYQFVVASSGVAAEKTGSAMEKYNRLSELANSAVQIWNKMTGREDPHLAAAIASAPAAAETIRQILEGAVHARFEAKQLLDRFEYFLAESEQIIPAAADSLSKADTATFGAKVDYSQQLAEILLGNQVPQTVFLAKSARRLGAAASTAFGAGFGGSVWAMVKISNTQKFIEEWSAEYKNKFPDAADKALFIPTRPGPAAFAL